jgi:pimeloyl-ACP methyl ester carboxylesterase
MRVSMWGVLTVGGLLLGAGAQAFCVTRDRRRLRPPGRTASGLHVREAGTGSRVVVFEAGLAATSVNWSRVQQALGAQTRSVSYDRAGLGWSAPVDAPRSLQRWSDDLHRLIHALDLPRPLTLVGHSFGTFIIRVYASRFPQDVAALVFLDPVMPDEFSPLTWRMRVRLWRAAFFTEVTRACAFVGLVRLGLWGLLRRGEGNPGPLLGLSTTCRRIARELAKLPSEELPALRAHWSEPRFFRELAASIRAMPACAAEAAGHPVPSDIPLVVFSGGHQSPQSLAAHAAMSTRQIVVEGSAHWIHLDRPEFVADTILSLIPWNPGA